MQAHGNGIEILLRGTISIKGARERSPGGSKSEYHHSPPGPFNGWIDPIGYKCLKIINGDTTFSSAIRDPHHYVNTTVAYGNVTLAHIVTAGYMLL